ncbi:hypothetical protein [Candidatus Clostridium radicumherbarum]|uniref:Uncharacterized protein n=1 Tax=Candidatus Clostridium radicumherbarum TaxID=3381662 RepID=A0ABW8TTD3_9CLOT
MADVDYAACKQMSLDECKQITKMTKDFIVKETESHPIMDSGYDQLNIRLKFDINRDSYVFESPYWVSTEIPNDNPNTSVENNYTKWYFNINDILQTTFEF